METGRLFVDGVDIFSQYGLYVTDGGWCQLAAWPALKSVDSNDWQEEDGEEVDLSTPVLDTRDITVTFGTHGDARPFSFISAIVDGAYHEFNCAYLGRTYTLRLVSYPKLDYAARLSTFSLKFADDFPMPDYEYEEPGAGMNALNDYLIDDRDVAEYGVRVLQGTLSNVLQLPDVKTAMLRNITTQAGAIYDPESVTFKTKNVKIICLMRATSLEALWRQWDALLYDLVRPGERSLYVAEIEQEFPFYYKECEVTELDPERLWLEFTMTLTFIRDFTINDDDVILATQDDTPVVTEDEDYYINMRYPLYNGE